MRCYFSVNVAKNYDINVSFFLVGVGNYFLRIDVVRRREVKIINLVLNLGSNMNAM